MASSEGATKLFAGRIESTIRAVAAERGAQVVRDVLLDLGERTEYYSFVLIDQYGLLGIDVQVWVGAQIEGSSGSKTWCARLKGEKPTKFQSALAAMDRRSRTIVDVLAACGRRIGPDYIAGLAVFAGADLTKLQLTTAEQSVVIDSDALASALAARHDFAVNPGALEPGEVGDLVSLITTLNRFDDAEAQARHMGLVTAERGLLGTWFERQRGIQVGVSNSAVGVAPVAMRLSEDRYPSHTAGAPAMSTRRTSPVAWLALVAIALLLGAWLFVLGGWSQIATAVEAFSGGVQQPAELAIPPTGQAPSVELEHAKTTLKDTAPEVYSQATDLDTPLVNHAEEFTLYTWHYVDKAGQARTITLTFDASGMLRGANQQ